MDNVSAEGVTAVVHCSSDVQPQRLRNCLLAIERQEFERANIDIVIGCLHSGRQGTEALCKLVDEFGATLVLMENWSPAINTALMRNLGARRAARRVTAFVDVDTVMDPEVFALAYPLVKDGEEVAFVPHQRMESPPEDALYRLEKSDFRCEQAKSTWQDTNVGGNVLLLTSQVHAVRGYDERMFGWGAEDHDFLARVGQSAHPLLVCLPVWNMHQHHEHRPWRQPSFFERNQHIQLENERRGGDHVNTRCWGGVPVGEDAKESTSPIVLPQHDGPMGRLNPWTLREALGVSTTAGAVFGPVVPVRATSEERAKLLGLLWEQGGYDIPLRSDDQPIRVVWDVGAKCGLYSLWASEVYEEAAIHSFEPCSCLAQVAYENLRLHTRVEVHRFGLAGATTGMRSVGVKVESGCLNFSVVGPEDADAVGEELFCAVRDEFDKHCKVSLDVIRFGLGTNPEAVLATLGAERLAKVRFVQLDGDVLPGKLQLNVRHGKFECLNAAGKQDGVRCFRNAGTE